MPPRLSAKRALPFNAYNNTCSHRSALAACPRTFVTRANARASPASRRLPCSFGRPGPSRSFHASRIQSAPKDPYQVLGVKRDATPAEIKKTYFALARKYHPDTNPDKDAREKFVEIQEAYDILKDEKKRAEYDKYGSAAQQPGFDANAFENARSAFGGGGFGFGGPFSDFSGAFGGAFGSRGRSNIFEELFSFGEGGGQGFAQSSRGSDIETTVGVSFMEACKGTSRNVTIRPIVKCDTCSGTGLKPGAQRSTCNACDGSGMRSYVVQNGFHMSTICNKCQGTGTVVPPGSQCSTCAGVGQVRVKKTVKVDIPAGVEDGVALKIPGQGDAPVSGTGRPGDLLVRINVAPSKTFKRQGSHLYHEVRIPVHTALLGGRVRVPTLDGEVDVRVPSGTQPGEQMVLRGHGVAPAYQNNKGDLYVTFNVQLPRSLTPRQRELLQQFADDVEGRTSASSRTSSSSTAADGPSSSGTSSQAQTDTTRNDTSRPSDERDPKERKDEQGRPKTTA